jgi:creatinine amidohydrolase
LKRLVASLSSHPSRPDHVSDGQTRLPQEVTLWEHLTWPEVNEAAEAGKVVLLPVGSTEQHGHHLPLDTDNLLARAVCIEAAERAPRELLVMPCVPFGYNEHALDFPGTIHVAYDTFISYCLDVVKSVAHAGFDRIVIVNGHGSNEPLCEFVGRRGTIETSALVASTTWWLLAREEFEEVRDSPTGGAAHACEMETSAYLYLAPTRVRTSLARDHVVAGPGVETSAFAWGDLTRGSGPVKLVNWTSGSSPNGVGGMPTLATAAKGRVVIQAAGANLLAFCREFRALQEGSRHDHRAVKPNEPDRPC